MSLIAKSCIDGGIVSLTGVVSRDAVYSELAKVMHPAIDRSLMDLGIIRDIEVEGGRVRVSLAFPFPNIPIRDHLIDLVREPLVKMGAEVEIETTVMSKDELQRFLAMERESWKGF
mgnify:CR=1 FL=1